jgi:5-hydroxyisourate hydrolase-like protein (transthyretin family)
VGIIKNQYEDEGPAAGLIVEAFDKDLRSEEILGETITDQNGKYEISYSKQQFRRAEKKMLIFLFGFLKKTIWNNLWLSRQFSLMPLKLQR